MTVSQKMAANAAPLLLRLGLALVFIWAGYGKLFYVETFGPEQAAVLAQLGVSTTDAAPDAPGDADAPEPELDPDANVRAPGASPRVIRAQAEQPAEEEEAQPEESQPEEAQGEGDEATGEVLEAPTEASPDADVAEVITGPVEARRLYYLAYLLKTSSEPNASGSGQLWPSFLAGNTVIKLLAWAAPITEIVAGVFLIFGVFTRLSALSIAGTMAVAMTLTTIGPAVTGASASFLGFLPAPRFDSSDWVGAWQPWLFQFTLLLMALCLVLTGAGAASIDRRLFGSGKRDTRDSSGEETDD